MARRQSVFIFDPELIKSWKSPYRRAMLVALLEVKTDERIILEFLLKDLPKIMKHYTDALGVSIYDASPKKWQQKVRSIFRKRELYKPQILPEHDEGTE